MRFSNVYYINGFQSINTIYTVHYAFLRKHKCVSSTPYEYNSSRLDMAEHINNNAIVTGKWQSNTNTAIAVIYSTIIV